MTEGRKPLNDLDALNQKYYTIFQELQDASPALANCDAAFLSFVQNITEQYEAEYKQLFKKGEITKTEERIEKFNALNEQFYFMGEKLKANKEKLPEGLFAFMKDAMQIEYKKQYELLVGDYDPEMDRKIADQQALYDRIVPDRNLWRRFLLFFKKRTQNHAADLADIKANEKAEKVFAEDEAQITSRRAERYGAEALAAEFRERINTYFAEQITTEKKSEQSDEAEEEWEAEEAPDGDNVPAESEKEAKSDTAGAGEKTPIKAEEIPQGAPESAERVESGEKEKSAADDDSEAPPKKARRKRRCS